MVNWQAEKKGTEQISLVYFFHTLNGTFMTKREEGAE